MAGRDELLTIAEIAIYLAQQAGAVERNPAVRIGELMRRVERRIGTEAEEIEHWSRCEVAQLLEVARAHEPRFAPLLELLFATGLRRGEALGLQWRDIDFDESRIAVRRSITLAGLTTPKSGKSRRVALPPGLAMRLLDLLGVRRREALTHGWPDVPEWVF